MAPKLPIPNLDPRLEPHIRAVIKKFPDVKIFPDAKDVSEFSLDIPCGGGVVKVYFGFKPGTLDDMDVALCKRPELSQYLVNETEFSKKVWNWNIVSLINPNSLVDVVKTLIDGIEKYFLSQVPAHIHSTLVKNEKKGYFLSYKAFFDEDDRNNLQILIKIYPDFHTLLQADIEAVSDLGKYYVDLVLNIDVDVMCIDTANFIKSEGLDAITEYDFHNDLSDLVKVQQVVKMVSVKLTSIIMSFAEFEAKKKFFLALKEMAGQQMTNIDTKGYQEAVIKMENTTGKLVTYKITIEESELQEYNIAILSTCQISLLGGYKKRQLTIKASPRLSIKQSPVQAAEFFFQALERHHRN